MKPILNEKSVLLLCPSFFGYETAIKEGLIKLGAKEVFYLNDDPSHASLFFIETLKHFNMSIKKQIRRFENKTYKRIKSKKFDIVLTICGWALTSSFFERVRNNNLKENGKAILYYWDSLKLLKDDISKWRYFDEVLTFDNVDYNSNKDKMRFLPLFFTDDFIKKEHNDISLDLHDLITVGSFKMNRYFEIEKLKKSNPLVDFKSVMFARKSIFIHKLFRPKYRKVSLKNLSFVPLEKKDIVSLYCSARAVLDIPKSGQNGLTMRVFESLALGKKVVTSNENITQYDFYDPSFIYVLKKDKPLPPKEWFEKETDFRPAIIQKYSLENWLLNIFSENA